MPSFIGPQCPPPRHAHLEGGEEYVGLEEVQRLVDDVRLVRVGRDRGGTPGGGALGGDAERQEGQVADEAGPVVGHVGVVGGHPDENLASLLLGESQHHSFCGENWLPPNII